MAGNGLPKQIRRRLYAFARRVASPKGTTEQGLAVLDAENGLQQLVDRTIEAAVRRSKELAAEAARRN